MTGNDSILTAELFGLWFVVSDVLLLATLLWLFDVVTWVWPAGTVAVIGALFGLWVGLRWRRLDRADDSLDSIERIKHRYTTGEISEAALEARLEEHLDPKRDG